MTYVQYINCAKWKKVIGISLWIGASVGLGILLNGAIQNYGTSNYGLFVCHNVFQGSDQNNPFGSYTQKCDPDYQTESIFVAVAIAINIGNYFMVWRTLNNHYRWLLIKCGEKPFPNEVKHE